MENIAPRLSILRAQDAARRRIFSIETIIKGFFGGNALVAVVVLALITIFLFREGFGFFGQNLANLRLYRRAGLEYVDIMRAQADGHAALVRWLHQISLAESVPNSREQIDQFADKFSGAGTELSALVSDAGDQALALREALAGREPGNVDIETPEADSEAALAAPIDVKASLESLRTNTAKFESVAISMKQNTQPLLNEAPQPSSEKAQKSFAKWKAGAVEYLNNLPKTVDQLRRWNPDVPIPWYRSVTSFLFGKNWVTASFWQDWYGIIPLLAGSILVSLVALVIAVPLGVSAAIYVSEVAASGEKRLIKPYIEFISAIPSVVLGFFGIAVVGQAIRALSQTSFMKWVPFFPISERLNAVTAGCLLALMAIPTIFTLAEDALRNVPRGFKEASYALGANRLQTIARVLVPASLSGIISAILLGLGRVIGETMVVLLCAGNRIAIPDFTQGLGAFFQPVHTMTGIIAQEMGEVVRGSIHYRALFMVGLILFVLTLGINYLAQKMVARYRMSIG
ncbi:MAG: phosphate transport system permease protein [Verrucomicrobiota bacterium]